MLMDSTCFSVSALPASYTRTRPQRELDDAAPTLPTKHAGPFASIASNHISIRGFIHARPAEPAL